MYRGINVKRSHRHEHFWQISIQTIVLNRVFDLEKKKKRPFWQKWLAGYFGSFGTSPLVFSLPSPTL